MDTMIMENEAYKNIVTRTSVRRFSDRKIDAEIVDALLRAGMSAPTGVNRQPWEFIVVNDSEILKELAESLPYAKMTAHAPLAIMVCGNSDRFLSDDDATLWVQDLSAASENILLAAHALSLGGVWTCLYPHADRVEAAGRIVGIPQGIIPFNLIPIGYPEKAQAPMDKWHPDRVHYNRY